MVLPSATIAVHGGAGVVHAALQRHGEEAYRDALRAALAAGHAVLSANGSALDAVEAAVRELEDSPLFNAGRGSVYCDDGTHRMEASLQDGASRAAGAVIGLQSTRHPISAARAVMERTRHVALVDCDGWAAAQGLEQRPPEWFDTADRLEQLLAARRSDRLSLDHDDASASARQCGTVGAVALDRLGRLAAATSTGGMTNKMAGRVGDTPVIGAGTHACGLCALSATGKGEQFLRHAVTASIGARVACGVPLAVACDEVVHGILQPGDGGCIGIDRFGVLSMPFNTEGMFRGWLKEQEGVPHVAIWRDTKDKLLPAPRINHIGNPSLRSVAWFCMGALGAALVLSLRMRAVNR